jgi:hypothetical protein
LGLGFSYRFVGPAVRFVFRESTGDQSGNGIFLVFEGGKLLANEVTGLSK